MTNRPYPRLTLPLAARPRGGLARFLLFVLLPLAIGPLATMAALLYQQTSSDTTRQVAGQLNSLATLKTNQIDQWAAARTLDINNLARSPDVVEAARTFVLEASESAAMSSAGAALTARLEDYIIRNADYKAFLLVHGESGEIVLSTSLYQDLVGQQLFLDYQYFRTARIGALVAPPRYDPVIDPVNVYFVNAAPVPDPSAGNFAVLIGVLIPERLQDIVAPSPGLGATGRAYLVTSDGYELGTTILPNIVKPDSFGIRRALLNHESGSNEYYNPEGEYIISVYRWLPRFEMALLVEENENEAYAPLTRAGIISAVIAALAVIFTTLGVLVFTRRLTHPIEELTEDALKMAGGNLDIAVTIKRNDEIGLLADAFASMARQLKDVLGNLEARVAERTALAERRTKQVSAGAEIAHAASTELDPDSLLKQVVNLIRDRFALYYAGAFMLDSAGTVAELRAGTGEAGAAMLASGHRLEVGGRSMIGRAIAERQARIALDVGSEAVRFNNPALPLTRSEMALPLLARDRVLGALTIQSDLPAAFSDEDIVSLQGMADLIAVALDNARLFQEAQRALAEVTTLHQRYLSQAWATFASASTAAGKPLSYIYDGEHFKRGEPVTVPGLEQMAQSQKPVITRGENGDVVTVPIRLRDQIIGALALEAGDPAHRWEADELALIEAAAEQAAIALENARLIEEAENALAETRRLAAREQTVNVIAGKVRSVPNVDSILTTALVELGKTLGASRGSVRLGVPKGDSI